ncbi:hypothetical protein T439DRAFT_312402 [Meredithblackwellia eburnea MCA 4105]
MSFIIQKTSSSIPITASANTASKLCSACLPAARRHFSQSATTNESKAKRKSRLVRKNHLEHKQQIATQLKLQQPNPVTGAAKSNDQLWQNSKLKNVLLDRQQVWGNTVSVLSGETSSSSSSSSTSISTTEQESQETRESDSADNASEFQLIEPTLPTHLNFGLDPAIIKDFSTNFPLVATSAAIGPHLSATHLLAKRFSEASGKELEKRNSMLRVLDLRNANAKGIEVENTRRIIKAFGEHEGDSGRPEVQAAIITARIHNLLSHLTTQPRDVNNRRPLRSLIQQRAKVLKYLRSVDVARYETCLKDIGVEPRAVEGEVIVEKKTLRELIRGAQ